MDLMVLLLYVAIGTVAVIGLLFIAAALMGRGGSKEDDLQ